MRKAISLCWHSLDQSYKSCLAERFRRPGWSLASEGVDFATKLSKSSPMSCRYLHHFHDIKSKEISFWWHSLDQSYKSCLIKWFRRPVWIFHSHWYPNEKTHTTSKVMKKILRSQFHVDFCLGMITLIIQSSSFFRHNFIFYFLLTMVIIVVVACYQTVP